MRDAMRRNGTFVWLTALLACCTGSSLRAADAQEDAVRVYKQLKPSVISLENAEGSGTGVIIAADGLVLTNAHVVNSPLPFELKADVEEPGGKTKLVRFKRLTVVGYHPRLDLALVRIDAKELKDAKVTLKPAIISKTKGDTGQQVFVIGDPAGGSQVLTKSITAGMLSSNDREVDGEHYYQTDAAINPGNSGGPMCDRTGKVLGLVTFKFTNVQAIGFAIPLHDVDFKTFVEVTRRKTDPKRAKELMEEADRFSDMGAEAGRRDGQDSPMRMRWNFYAAECYRLALTYDPANPDLFYNIGMLLRTLDEDKIATAYLAREIALRPWDGSGNPYRELGFSLVKQEKQDQALTAWQEGISKFPYNAKIWEDLAIYHMTHQKPADAAQDAAVALLIAEKDTRLDVVRNILKDARSKVASDPTAAADLEKRLERPALVAKLDQLLEGSNMARSKRIVYITKPFATLMLDIGGAPVTGVEQRISLAPIKRLAELGQATATATPVTPPAKTVQKPATPSAPPPATPKVSKGTGDDWVGGTPAKPKPDSKTTVSGKNTTPAGDDWVGAGTAGKPGPAALPEPVVTGKVLAQTTRALDDAQVTPLAADVKDVTSVEWSADGKFAFVLQSDGILRKLAVPTFKEERQVALSGKCANMVRCQLGLAVALKELQEVWVLDDMLKVQHRVHVGGVARVAGSPAVANVYAVASQGHLVVLDMNAEKKVDEITTQDMESQRGEGGQDARGIRFDHLIMSPDGQYLFCQDGSLHRLKIAGTRVLHEQRGTGGGNPQQIIVSGDSKYVCMPCGGGNSGIESLPNAPYSTYVFRVSDLKTPVINIASGAYPQTLGFDPVAHQLYAQNHGSSLMVYEPSGVRGKEYKFDRHGPNNADQFYVHPDGKKVLIRDRGKLVWIVLP